MWFKIFLLYFQNGTIWQPDACSVCTCQSQVVMCEQVRCEDPGCDYLKVSDNIACITRPFPVALLPSNIFTSLNNLWDMVDQDSVGH